FASPENPHLVLRSERGVPTGRAVATRSPYRLVQSFDLDELGVLHFLHHQLRYAVSASHHDRLDTIDTQQAHPDLTPVTGVDRARRVDDRKAHPGRQSGPGVHETGVTLG